MATDLGRTGNLSSQHNETYEFSYLVDLRLLASLTTNYISVYGEELTDEKMNKFVVDLLYGLMTGTRNSFSHRWMGKYFVEGFDFIELFEKEASKLLSSSIATWREFEPECIHILVETHLASTFIGFKHMLPGVNRTLLDTYNGLDTYIDQRIHSLFEQEVVLDFSNSMAHEVCEQELLACANGRITWAYLIEECMRINLTLRRDGVMPININRENVIELLDQDELRMRYEGSPLMDRLLTCEDAFASDRAYENILIDLAGLIARILFSNSEILAVIYQQLVIRLSSMNYTGNYALHCISFNWLNRAGIAKFAVYPTALGNPVGSL